MKIRLLTLVCVALCAACSAPKMAYKFDYHDYNAGRKAKEVQQEVASNPGPVAVQPETLVAMEPVGDKPVTSIETIEKPSVITAGKTYEDMTKKERRVLRHELKKEVKTVIKKKDKESTTNAEAAKGLDRDLKLAIIFGAVGVVALIISGQVFYIIGGVALIVGVVFFVKWLIRQ